MRPFFLLFLLLQHRPGMIMPPSISPGPLLRRVNFQASRFVIKNSNLSINSTTLAGVVCAPTGFIFGCDSYSPWAYECLNSWHITRQCLLFNYAPNCPQREAPHWSTPLNLHSWVRRNYHSWCRVCFQNFGRALLPWLGVNISEAMIRNLSLTVENIAEFTAEAIAAKEKSLDSLAKVDVDYRVAPDYLLAEQGGVCVVSTTTCYTWTNTPG